MSKLLSSCVHEGLDWFPHLYDYLPLEECIVVLNVSGIVLRKRKAEKKQQDHMDQYVIKYKRKMILNSRLKDHYLRQLLRNSLLRPSSLIFKCSLYCISCFKYKGEFLQTETSLQKI